jgi:alpha-2-macroglobulin-like protein
MAHAPRVLGVLCLAIAATDAAAAPVLHDATVASDRDLVRGAEATVYVAVSGARSLTRSDPVEGASVELDLVADRKARRRLASGKTDRAGNAVLRFRVPKIEPGRYKLVVTTSSAHGRAVTERDVEVSDKLVLHLRTDRGVYKPGGTLRWRVTALGGADAHPAAGDPLEVVVHDPSGTVIWRQQATLSRSGMAAGELPLGDDLVTGSYSLEARVRGIETRETVQLREVRLPAFEVRLEPRPRVDGRFAGRVTARYRYGEPVRGQVKIGTDRENARLRGKLDASGQLAFTLPLRDGENHITAVVTDGADRSEEASIEIPSESRELRVALVPESSSVVAGGRSSLTVVTTDERGHLAPARISLRLPGRERRIALESKGAVRIAVRVPTATDRWQPSVSAVAADGEVAQHRVEMRVEPGGTSLHLREAVVAAGQPVVVEGQLAAGSRGPVLATLLRDGAPIASAVTSIGPRGAVRAELSPPTGSFGLASVRLVTLGWEPRRSARQEHDLNLYLRPAELAVEISGEKRRRPGERVELAVAVKDAAGRPVEGAGLAASVVDERVLALSEPRPDLVAALRTVDDIHDATRLGLAFSDLLAAAPSAERDAALRAIIEALPVDSHAPELVIPAEERYRSEEGRIERAGTASYAVLRATPGAIGVREGSAWRYRSELWQLLASARWKEADRATPWSQPTTWAYALELDPELAFDKVAPRVAEDRLNELAKALRRKRARSTLLRRGSVALRELAPRHLAIDPWGTAIRVERVGGHFNPLQSEVTVSLVSAGPDLRFDTGDDQRVDDVFETLGGFGYGSLGSGAGGGGTGFGYGSGSGRGGMRQVNPAPLRARFDETVLWRVGASTSAAGRATLAFSLSDSITGWQVAVEAVSPAGAVGTATSRLETFLPLHLDAELPARLAVGDSYRIPIAVANHSGAAQTLEVTARLGGALRGNLVRRLALDSGATSVVFVRARAAESGRGTVRLELKDRAGKVVDRVLRRIPIEPRGELVRIIHAGEVVEGRGAIRFQVAGDAAPRSASGLLRLYRGAADQALDGLEGMLQEPYGCFEQTSSATYPNLLVLRLLRDAPGADDVRRRARDMVGRGYQRLISYEVKGGGFSWFGESPANQVLTAYGLMEFVDMGEVYPVDRAMVERTRTWLLAQQRADGSWKPDASWLHDWSEVQGRVSTTAFVAWALAESGYRGPRLQRALGFLRAHQSELASDPYRLALWAATQSLVSKKQGDALALLTRRGAREKDGLVFRAGARKTLFYASGESADAQVTALAATALHRAGRGEAARSALDWLWKVRSPNYGWGTTQSTVLALRAAAIAAPKPPPAEGSLTVRLDGRLAGRIDLAAAGVPSLELPSLAAGAHEIALEGSAAGRLRADLRLRWRGGAAGPASARGLAIELEAPDQAARVGGSISLRATVRNPGSAAVAMPTVVLPVPPGFGIAADVARRLARVPGVSRVEDHGDSLAVYLLELAPGARVVLPYELDAGADCDVLQRPALAYAYYTPDVRGTSRTLRLRASATANRARPVAVATLGASQHEGERHQSPAAAVWW